MTARCICVNDTLGNTLQHSRDVNYGDVYKVCKVVSYSNTRINGRPFYEPTSEASVSAALQLLLESASLLSHPHFLDTHKCREGFGYMQAQHIFEDY